MTRGWAGAALLLVAVACGPARDNVTAASPDGVWRLRSQRHEGTLVRLVISRPANPTEPTLIDTRDTDAMKWVAGWSREGYVLFYGSDTGATIARRWDGATWSPVAFTADLCGQLASLFAKKYGRGEGPHCIAGDDPAVYGVP